MIMNEKKMRNGSRRTVGPERDRGAPTPMKLRKPMPIMRQVAQQYSSPTGGQMHRRMDK